MPPVLKLISCRPLLGIASCMRGTGSVWTVRSLCLINTQDLAVCVCVCVSCTSRYGSSCGAGGRKAAGFLVAGFRTLRRTMVSHGGLNTNNFFHHSLMSAWKVEMMAEVGGSYQANTVCI